MRKSRRKSENLGDRCEISLRMSDASEPQVVGIHSLAMESVCLVMCFSGNVCQFRNRTRKEGYLGLEIRRVVWPTAKKIRELMVM